MDNELISHNANINTNNEVQKKYIASLYELSVLKQEIINKYVSIQSNWSFFSSSLNRLNSSLFREKKDNKF